MIYVKVMTEKHEFNAHHRADGGGAVLFPSMHRVNGQSETFSGVKEPIRAEQV